MRKQWFGDSRDYVKWSCIRQEAGTDYIVVYVVMLRPDSFEDPLLDQAVVKFFDRQKDFKALKELFPKGFEVFERIYEKNDAGDYFKRLLELITENQSKGKVLVFLDPDTGIEPTGKTKNEHLQISDIRALCNSLSTGDKLVIYQHALHRSDWREHFSKQLKAIGVETRMELTPEFCAPGVSKDVCFFTLIRR